MIVSTKKKFVWLAGLALVLIGAAIFWLARSGESQKPLAAVPLGDGRILQVEAVTYGVNHHVGNESSDNLLWRFTAWLPGWLCQWFASRNPESTINGLDFPALVVWVNAVNAVTGTNVDCQRVRVEIVDKHGEHFGSGSSWFGSQSFWRVGHIFRVYPRDETNLTLRVTNWKNNQSSLIEIPNPHVVRPAEWAGADLPQQTTAGDLNIVLAGLRFRTNNASPKYYQTRTVYWEPEWELRRGAEKVGGWAEPEWLAEDPLGNRGQYLGTNQPLLRFSATFYPSATNAAAQLLASLPQSPVTNRQNVVWWNQTARQGSNNLLVLGLFPPGTWVFEAGHLLTNPPPAMGPVRGGAPSGWTAMSRVVNALNVIHYNSHYSISNSVIYVSAPDFRGPARLAMRLRDEQGRDWVANPESQGSESGIYPFLIELPPDVNEVTPELVLLNPVTAAFTVRTPAISNATAGAASPGIEIKP